MEKLAKAEDIMTKNLITLKESMDIYEAVGIFLKNKISGAPVIDETGHLTGMLSEKDCLRLLLDGAYHDAPDGKVSEYMTDVKQSVNINADILTIAGIFINNPFKRVPVLDENGALAGQISRTDVLKEIAKMRK